MARYSNDAATQPLVAQNSVFGPVRARLGRRTGGVTLQTGPSVHASFAVSLQGSNREDGGFTDIDLINPDDAGGAVIEGLVGADKAGTAPLNASSFEYFRVVRTDANGSSGKVYLTIQ